jgi:hypothetical protein
MRIKLTIFLTFLSLLLKAQSDSLYLYTEVENEIYSIDFKSSKTKLLNYVEKNKIRIVSQKDSKDDIKIKFVLDQQKYSQYDSLIKSLGYSTSKNVNTTSNYNKYCEIQLELDYLKKKRDAYVDLIKKIDEKSENYLTLWNEQKLTEEKIFNKERELLKLNKRENTFTVSLDLNDETTSPEYTDVSFVNMPGVEFSYLTIETPKSGISASNYQGYLLKYLFTKGKSFGTIGVYKNNDIGKTDTTAFSEMFLLGFGQDFYSRHLGRGSRKFLNLYSGYTIGGLLATGKNNKSNMFFIAPSIGLELFKNKYFLIDAKVNYFVPLSNNKNLRGFSYNTSFNFVF